MQAVITLHTNETESNVFGHAAIVTKVSLSFDDAVKYKTKLECMMLLGPTP